MLKLAIVGCGKIADDHAWAARSVAGCRIEAVCDREELMARQLADRFEIERTFGDLGAMLSEVKPDVVHITTPPQSHYSIARQCLEGGAHVYVEKPFTVHAAEAAEVVKLAEQKGRCLTVGHDRQFCPASRAMRALIAEGYLGGPPVHMESYYGYDLGFGSYAKALLADQSHWVRKLPGQLLQNIISHGVARIAEHLPTETPEVIATGFVSARLRELGEVELIDELRVIIMDRGKTTAYFTVSSQARPLLNQFHAYGRRNGLIMDQQKQSLIRLPGKAYPSYAEQFIPPVLFTGQHLANLRRNLALFLRRRFHQKSGMKHLVGRFYEAVRGKGPLPIPYREILLTSRLMETIFIQLSQPTQSHPAPVPTSRAPR